MREVEETKKNNNNTNDPYTRDSKANDRPDMNETCIVVCTHTREILYFGLRTSDTLENLRMVSINKFFVHINNANTTSVCIIHAICYVFGILKSICFLLRCCCCYLLRLMAFVFFFYFFFLLFCR